MHASLVEKVMLVISSKTLGLFELFLISKTIKEKVSALTALGKARAASSGIRNLLKIQS